MRRTAPALVGLVLLAALVALALALVPADVLPGTVAVARDFTPAQVAREEAFHAALRPSAYGSLLLGVLVAAALGATRWGSRLVEAVGRVAGRRWVLQVAVAAPLLGGLGRLATLPLDVRSEHVLRVYGLSTRSWAGWLLDVLRGWAVTSVATALALVVVVGLARWAPRTWWAWSAAVVAALVMAGSFVYPLVVEPVFNSFRPLPGGQLRDDLLALAREDGVPVSDVLVADASRRTTALNAYVSGYGSSRRIVLYDTLVEQAPPAEVRLVVAHELGHVSADDVLVGSALGALAAATGVCLLGLVLSSRTLLGRVGATGAGDPRVVPLVLGLVAVVSLLTTPVVDLGSRRVEARADLHALELTGDVDTFIASERRLSVTNLSDLDPGWLPRALSTHPTGPERIALARAVAAGPPVRTLVVTNDFPPRPGGIQAYVAELARRQPDGEVVVYAPSWRGAPAYDAAQPFPVVRHPGTLVLPVPDVLRRARAVAAAEGCDRVWFGAAAPLGLLARPLGLPRAVASTHGHEVGWAVLPGARQVLRRIGRDVDVVTYLGDYTRARLEPALGPAATLAQLPSGVDTTAFRPGAGGEQVRRRHGLGGRPVVVCVSRLVPRKGQDVLVRALPALRRRVPGTALLLVGGGPDAPRLRRLAAETGVAEHVVLTGSVPWEELPAHYDAGDVFAMPCRTRRGGLEVEGLGIVFLEASATGLPVVAGRSGGSPDAVLDGRTGTVVDGTRLAEVTGAVAALLEDPERARRLGAAGRAWVEQQWRWDVLAARLRGLLAG